MSERRTLLLDDGQWAALEAAAKKSKRKWRDHVRAWINAGALVGDQVKRPAVVVHAKRVGKSAAVAKAVAPVVPAASEEKVDPALLESLKARAAQARESAARAKANRAREAARERDEATDMRGGAPVDERHWVPIED